MRHSCPFQGAAPIFPYVNQGQLQMVTQSQAQSMLANVLASIVIDPAKYGFHTFSCSSASLDFSLDIPVQFIQANGTWKFEAVWQYRTHSYYPT